MPSWDKETQTTTPPSVDEKKALEDLRDHLVGADKQHHFPFRPVADAIDLSENDAEENNLSAKPKDLDNHPEQEICLETHLANKRIAQHDGVDFDVTAHRGRDSSTNLSLVGLAVSNCREDGGDCRSDANHRATPPAIGSARFQSGSEIVAAKRSAAALAQFIAALRADDLQILSDLHSRNVHGHDPEQIEGGKNRHTSRFASEARREFPLLQSHLYPGQ